MHSGAFLESELLETNNLTVSEIASMLRRNSPFSILHFPFSILHSQFSIFHSPFSILHSPFSILSKMLITYRFTLHLFYQCLTYSGKTKTTIMEKVLHGNIF